VVRDCLIESPSAQVPAFGLVAALAPIGRASSTNSVLAIRRNGVSLHRDPGAVRRGAPTGQSPPRGSPGSTARSAPSIKPLCDSRRSCLVTDVRFRTPPTITPNAPTRDAKIGVRPARQRLTALASHPWGDQLPDPSSRRGCGTSSMTGPGPPAPTCSPSCAPRFSRNPNEHGNMSASNTDSRAAPRATTFITCTALHQRSPTATPSLRSWRTQDQLSDTKINWQVGGGSRLKERANCRRANSRCVSMLTDADALRRQNSPHRTQIRAPTRRKAPIMSRIRQLLAVTTTLVAPIVYVIVETAGGRIP